MQVWILATFFAAFMQNLRFLLQRHLRVTTLSTMGATWARFAFATPFVALFLGLWLALTGQAMPAPMAVFWAYAVGGAMAQMLATACVVALFGRRNFAVGVTLSKTEVILTALIGLIVLGEAVSMPVLMAIMLGFVAVILAYVIMTRHVLGYKIRLAGQAPRAARFGGVNAGRLVILCMGVSGALAGMAGLFEVSGPAGRISIDFNVGYGFTAIIVAFLGRLNPIGILLAGLLLALTFIGGELAQLMLGIPAPAIQAFQGMLLFFLLALDVLANYRVKLKRRVAA